MNIILPILLQKMYPKVFSLLILFHNQQVEDGQGCLNRLYLLCTPKTNELSIFVFFVATLLFQLYEFI